MNESNEAAALSMPTPATSSTAYFVTGTDTGVGKTHAACTLVHVLRRQYARVAVMKPVASGCEPTPQGWRNADALDLIEASGTASDYAQVNPYALKEAIAPHLAARHSGIEVDLDVLASAYAQLRRNSDAIVVEGAGGWSVPLSDALMQADLVRRLNLPVLLVVGVRLGCINHALLSARAILAEGFQLAGWIANRIDPGMPSADENVACLSDRLPAPLLADLPHAVAPAMAASRWR